MNPRICEPEANHGNNYGQLPLEIERLRNQLNEKVAQNDSTINSEDTLELSKKLDELIVRHVLNEMGYPNE